MSNTLQEIIHLIHNDEVRISVHGYDELAADKISVRDVIAGIETAVLVEDYPDYHKGRAVLVLQLDAEENCVGHSSWENITSRLGHSLPT